MGDNKLYGSYRCDSCGNPVISGERCVTCKRRGVEGEMVTCGYINQNPETGGGKMTDTYDVYCDKCGHLTAVLSHTCEEELTALLEENVWLKKKLNKASRFIEFCKAWSWIPENPREGE
jgi:predicted nucleic acid-binding Zn ribbon protein